MLKQAMNSNPKDKTETPKHDTNSSNLNPKMPLKNPLDFPSNEPSREED
jgi:hypothetical protein